MSALNKIIGGRASLFVRRRVGAMMNRADLTEKELSAHVRQNIDKNGEWKGALPEEPIRFTESGVDLEAADIIAPKRALSGLIGMFVALGAAYGLVAVLTPERPYAPRTFPFGNLWVERGYDPALAPKDEEEH